MLSLYDLEAISNQYNEFWLVNNLNNAGSKIAHKMSIQRNWIDEITHHDLMLSDIIQFLFFWKSQSDYLVNHATAFPLVLSLAGHEVQSVCERFSDLQFYYKAVYCFGYHLRRLGMSTIVNVIQLYKYIQHIYLWFKYTSVNDHPIVLRQIKRRVAKSWPIITGNRTEFIEVLFFSKCVLLWWKAAAGLCSLEGACVKTCHRHSIF